MPPKGPTAHDAFYLGTPMHHWKEIRALAKEDHADGGQLAVADLLADAYDKNAQNPTDLYQLFGNSFTSILLAFLGGTVGSDNPADLDTFGYTILGYAADAGGDGQGNPPIWLCHSASAVDCKIGPLTTALNPTTGLARANGFYADLLVHSNVWIGGSDISDASSSSRIAFLRIKDLLGIKYLKVHIAGADGGQAGEAPGIQVIGRVY